MHSSLLQTRARIGQLCDQIRAFASEHVGAVRAGAMTLAVCIVASSVALLDLGSMRPRWPIDSVGVSGELRQVERAELEAVIQTTLASDFFDVDVAALRRAALSLPWVKDASVRRVWPEHLDIHISERQVVARWKSGGLVSVDGELFHPKRGRGLDLLPQLSGPIGQQGLVLNRYRELVTELAPLERRVVRVAVDKRGNWNVGLEGGLALVLGAEAQQLNVISRALRRALSQRLAHVEKIDLRYANGFAVRWKASTQELAMRATAGIADSGATK
jgi:cell division protein FtsQ